MSLFPKLTHEDSKRIAGFSLLLLMVVVIASQFSMQIALLAAVLGVFVLGTTFIAHYHRESDQKRTSQSEHIQDLQFLHDQIPLRKPLPYLTGWSASPALASRLYSLIIEKKPQVIMELGSGVSTVVMAYALEKNEVGHLISLDHDQEYAQKTRNELTRHRLSSFATVQHAPLRSYNSKGEMTHWYDLDALPEINNIDLLVVDGPPRQTGSNARLPAFEHLMSRLSRNGIIVLDDTARPCEQKSLEAWSNVSDPGRFESIASEKGVSVCYLRLPDDSLTIGAEREEKEELQPA